MHLAICGNSAEELRRLDDWICQFCVLYQIVPEIEPFTSPDRFTQAAQPGVFQAVFIGFGASKGFLVARALRERDKVCCIILIDDTDEYSIRGVRLHFTDFMLRPIAFWQVVRSMKLVAGGRL